MRKESKESTEENWTLGAKDRRGGGERVWLWNCGGGRFSCARGCLVGRRWRLRVHGRNAQGSGGDRWKGHSVLFCFVLERVFLRPSGQAGVVEGSTLFGSVSLRRDRFTEEQPMGRRSPGRGALGITRLPGFKRSGGALVSSTLSMLTLRLVLVPFRKSPGLARYIS